MRKFKMISLLLSVAFFISLQVNAQMEFVENKGQWHSNVNYRGDFKTGSFFLENSGFTVLMHNADDMKKLSDIIHGHSDGKRDDFRSHTLNSFAYKVKLLGAKAGVSSVPDKPLPTHNNYYLGNDPLKWASNVKVYTAVTYKDVYPNIDVRYYSSEEHLKYDFIVRPGGNPNQIAMQYSGPEVSVKNKELIITTPIGTVKELYPFTYQNVSGKNQQIDARYEVRNNVVTFKISNYDQQQTLIIDPSIIFSSFTGSTVDNWGYTATPGPDGSFYAGGIAFGPGYPVSPGAIQTTFGGGDGEDSFPGYDMAIFKFSANGSNRLYATYIGGDKNEQPHSMIADPQGNLVIAGRSISTNYPVTTPLVGSGGGYDIVVTKLSSDGTAMLGSMRIGGSQNDGVNIRPKWATPNGVDAIRRNYGDDARSEVILDAANNIVLASCTQSSNFPIRGTVPQTTFGGGRQDGAIIKLNPNVSAVIFSSFYGGSGDDACFVASISPVSGNLYVAGGTTSSNLSGTVAGVMSPTYRGGATDGFVTQWLTDGSAIVNTTYQGTSGADIVYGLKFDQIGFPYIMGTTTGNWPVLNAAYSNTNGKQFISKLQPDLSAHVYSTVFGTNSAQPNISPVAFLVDRCENVYVSGWGGGMNQSNYEAGSTQGLPQMNPLAGIPVPDGSDFYFFVLERNASALLFGSHFGQFGGSGDHVDGGTSRFDENGVVYQGICANCDATAAFPTTPGAWATRNGSRLCNQAAVKIEMNFAGINAGLQASINAVVNDTIGCVPLRVDFQDTVQLGKKFYWDFGDGSPQEITTTATNFHIFNSVGTFRVMLIAEDSATCNIRDSAYVNITVGSNEANLSFTTQKLDPCESLRMRFTNTSVPSVGTFAPDAFTWDFGDGSPTETGGLNPPREHTYASPGTYIVTLILNDLSFCNSPDTLRDTININPLVVARIETPPTGCAPYTVTLGNGSLAGTTYEWDFDDGTPVSTEFQPTHEFTNPGTYQIRLIVRDPGTCNLVDTTYFTLNVFSKPTAAFSWQPNPPVENTPVTFTNLSSPDAVSFLWDFGDGQTSVERNPEHQYDLTGTYEVMLVAYNQAGCTDTARDQVNAIVVSGIDVPNAFTPGKFGANSVISVKGFGLRKLNWRIYNRWGQLVFQTESAKQGWNGTFKGKLQPMDVYSYTLDVEFSDGQKLRKTGDITLIR